MTLRTLLIAALGFSASAQAADFTLGKSLSGLAAECFVIGATGLTMAGKTSDIDAVFAKTIECSDTAKLKGRDAYRSALQSHPALKDEITDLYSAWLGYIEELRQPRRLSSAETAAERDYKRALNRTQAVIDAQ